ncbi:hypothetical protein POL68_39795 [Stigmatella sp. ncwal1]|uniref:ATP-grasp domain-containing protein n=1 Tax=Stigmatella ashevillensis TaxID=2995309 RepID=A0ABT5DLV9_9BACT|nr:hypothetical protein [Stigmatella ashevillena]MDC0714660.1 hypothetical protein [Stigmatella ashevillena]
MPRAPVILSPHEDLNAAAVCWGLKQSGIEPLWSPSLFSGSLGTLSIHDSALEDRLELGSAQTPDVGAVWYRRPRAPPPSAEVLESDLPFVRGEWSLFQSNLFALAGELTGALWVNPPGAALAAENKLLQLRAARSAGLQVPDTLMSNDARAIRAFIARHGRVIYKTFMPHTWRDRQTHQFYNVNATLLDTASSFDDASVSMCPGIYQRYVEKVCDLRVTLVGDRMFPVRLRSTQGKAFVDWRAHIYHSELAADACSLSETFQHQLRDMMNRLGLVFGCVDLVVDPEGGIHFLEVNQGGQFLFLEELVDTLPLLKAMCALLAQGRPHYSLEPSPEISLQRYRASEEHQAWRARHGHTLGVEDWCYTPE